MVENAIVIPVLLMIIFGIMNFCQLFYAYQFASEAARDATRYAALRGSTFSTECSSNPTPYGCYALNSDIQTYVRGITPAWVVPSTNSLTTTTTWPGVLSGASGACTTTVSKITGVDDNPGCLVQVVVSYPFQFFSVIPILSSYVKNFTISSTSEVVIVQ
jgi:Flp pilus assembly protein TadG